MEVNNCLSQNMTLHVKKLFGKKSLCVEKLLNCVAMRTTIFKKVESGWVNCRSTVLYVQCILYSVVLYQVMSPLDVTIWLSSRNRQQDKYPVWPGNSLDTRTLPSLVFNEYMLQILSKPPQATKFPLGAYAHVITHELRSGMACTWKIPMLNLFNYISITPHKNGDGYTVWRYNIFCFDDWHEEFYYIYDCVVDIGVCCWSKEEMCC